MTTEMKIQKMSEIELQEVEWLWYPYIPFGKITIIQGDRGEGKTTLGLRLAAACSNGHGFPGMDELAPISVIYQTAEDGLGDTVKPRLMEAEANENLIFNISEETDVLTLKDERIEAAIKATNAKLMIFDPIQGYVGEDTDINRANEIRTVLKSVSSVAERTGCAIVLIGHLNKASGASSASRGLGSIDFRAAARSVLLIGRLKNDPTVRVIVHDKSSLAPEGKSLAFGLGDEEGFRWLDGYEDISDKFDLDKAVKLLNEVQNRISIINFKDSMGNAEEMSSILNQALDQIDFQFRKISEEELIIADAFRKTLERTRQEFARSLDPKDPEYVTLLEELKRVFKKKNIEIR